ncbi:MAG: hypothetical protein ACLTEE_11340 [Anaerobutyricum hallii]
MTQKLVMLEVLWEKLERKLLHDTAEIMIMEITNENCYCSGEIRSTFGSRPRLTFYAGGLISCHNNLVVQNCFSEVNLVMDVWDSFVVGSLVEWYIK